jgi:hypothetical protein
MTSGQLALWLVIASTVSFLAAFNLDRLRMRLLSWFRRAM